MGYQEHFHILDGDLYSYDGPDGHVTIPDGVKCIDKNVFYGREGITGVTIPATVKRIGEQAFFGCRGLTDLVVPNGVSEIGNGAF